MLVRQLLVTGLWGGMMALERRAFLQAMVSRPLVAGTVMGLLLDDVQAGLYVGLVFELLHLGGASLGTAQADHDTLPAVAGAAFACQLGIAGAAPATPAMWALAVLVAMPLGAAGRRLEARLDQRARKYFGRAVLAVDAGQVARAGRQNLRAMVPQFFLYGLACIAVALAGRLLGPLELSAPAPLTRGLSWAYPALGSAAAAMAVYGSRARQRFLAAGLASVVVGLVALAVWVRT